MSAAAEQSRGAAVARVDRGLDLGTWRGSRADLINDDLAAARLVLRIQSGDASAFDLLDRAFRRGVHRYLCSILRNPEDAEEVTQLVFMRALEKISTCRIASEPFGAWLYGIARNAAIDHLRKHTRVACEEPAAIDRRREGMDASRDAGWGSRQELHDEIERLPEIQRRVVVLRYLVGLSAAEVGTVLGCSADSVRHFHHRALRALRTRITVLLLAIALVSQDVIGELLVSGAGSLAG